MLKLKQYAAVALLGLGMASAIAQAPSPDPAFNAFMQQTVGNKTTISFSGTGTPLVSSSAPLGSPSLGTLGVMKTGEGVFLESVGGTRVPGRNTTVPIRVKLTLSGQAIGKALAKATLLYTGWEVGSALYDIWSDIGLTLNSDGSVVLPGNGPGSVSTGFGWYAGNYSYCGQPSGFANTCAWFNNAYDAADAQARIRFGDPFALEQTNSTSTSVSFRVYRLPGWTTLTNPLTVHLISNPTCPSGWYIYENGTCNESPPVSSLTTEELIDYIAQQSGWPDSTITHAFRDAMRLPGVASEVIPELQPAPLQVSFPGATGSIEVGDPEVTTVVRTLPNGNTEEITRTKTTTATPISSSPNSSIRPGVEWRSAITERRVERAPDGTIISDETTQETTEPVTDNIITCGLPNTPPCKIDEEGTPEPPEDDGGTAFELLFKPLVDCAADIVGCLPALPDLNLTFSFPSTCGTISIDAFSPWLSGINVCQWQGMFHDIMTLIWAWAGIWGAIAIVSRNPFA